jgi:hypothetical protein
VKGPGPHRRWNDHECDLTRRLGTFEHFLWATDKWTPRHFVIVARIEGELQPVSLAHALAHAQQRHARQEPRPLAAPPSLEELVIHQGALPSTSPASGRSDAKLYRPCQPLILSFEIEPRETATILTRCREEQTTLQGALMAAAMMSLDQPFARCLVPINLRPLCPSIDDDFGLYISSGMASFRHDDAVDFWPLARHARAQLASAFDAEALQGRFARLSALLAAHHDPQSIYEAYRQGVTFDVVVSNLGKFPASRQTNALRVMALYMLLNTELEPSIAGTTVEGRMSVSATFDSSTRSGWFEKLEHLVRSIAALAAR